jgi:butyrate kinase
MQDELSIEKARVAILVEERNSLRRELEEYKALYTDVAKKLNNANYRLSQIGDLVGGRGGLTMRAADDLEACPNCHFILNFDTCPKCGEFVERRR